MLGHENICCGLQFWHAWSGVSHAHKPKWLSQLGVSGMCSLGGSLKCWGTKCGLQTTHSSGSSWELGVLSRLYGTALGGVYGKNVSAFPILFNVGVFSFAQNVGVSQLVFGYLSEIIAPCVGCTFGVTMGERKEFRNSQVTILIDPPSQFTFTNQPTFTNEICFIFF